MRPHRHARRAWRFSLLVLTLLGVLGPAEAAELSLAWSDTSDNEDGFMIERRAGTGGTYSALAATGPDAESYVDSAVANGATYCYRVYAFNTVGASAYSNEACGTTPELLSLSIVKVGTGDGSVASSPAGINCGTSCSMTFSRGTTVSLTATPEPGSRFSGWSGGGCAGADACTVTPTATTTVTGTFTKGSKQPTRRSE